MKQKFWYLVSQSFMKKLKNKWFIVVHVILFLAIIGVANIDRIITFFGGDFSDTKEVFVVDHGSGAYEILESQINSYNHLLGIDYDTNLIKRTEDIEVLKEEVQDTNKILVVFDTDDIQDLKATVISSSLIDSAYYQYLYQVLNATKMNFSFQVSGMDMETYTKLVSNLEVDRVILDRDANLEDEMTSTIMGTVFPTLILPFFILVIFLVQMIGMEINEEKSSRSMEIIISNVSPKVHFFSKIVAGNAFVFLQGILLFVYGLIAFFIRSLTGGAGSAIELGTYIDKIVSSLSASGVLEQLIFIVPLTLILMILSFIAYSLVAGILASMTVSMEDFQQIQTPIIFVCLIGYYLAIMSGMFHGSAFIRILSYIPFLSCLLSPALFITNQIGIIDVLISIGALIVFDYGLIKFGLKVYKIGILNYSTDKMWSKIFRAVRERG